MAARGRVTVSLPIELMDAVRARVKEGKAASVSGYIRHAVQVALEDVTLAGASAPPEPPQPPSSVSEAVER